MFLESFGVAIISLGAGVLAGGNIVARAWRRRVDDLEACLHESDKGAASEYRKRVDAAREASDWRWRYEAAERARNRLAELLHKARHQARTQRERAKAAEGTYIRASEHATRLYHESMEAQHDRRVAEGRALRIAARARDRLRAHRNRAGVFRTLYEQQKQLADDRFRDRAEYASREARARNALVGVRREVDEFFCA